jgi:hypothetical protein
VVEFVPHELRANCVVGDAAPSESAVRCSEGPTSVIYRQRVPGAELGSAVRAAATVSGACTGHPPGDQPWTARQGDAAAGTIRVACAGAHVQIVWTNTRVNIVARADRTDGNVAALWTWWQAHGGPLERAAP